MEGKVLTIGYLSLLLIVIIIIITMVNAIVFVGMPHACWYIGYLLYLRLVSLSLPLSRFGLSENGQYGYMSTTEKNNMYSLTLPRYAFVHRDYLRGYWDGMPASIRAKVSDYVNCEDIALSFYVSSRTDGVPPLLADFWAMKSMVKLYSPHGGISSTHNHKSLRDDCVDSFADTLQLKHRLEPWVYIRPDTLPFEVGAKSQTKAGHMSKRQKKHESMIQKWKTLSNEDLRKELQQEMAKAATEAFATGLMENTKPWKKRWGHEKERLAKSSEEKEHERR